MSQSIDFRINDLINEYLDYKGYRKTVETFHQERKDREEPTERQSNGKGSIDEQAKHTQGLQEEFLEHFDRGNREAFFELWRDHIPTNLIDQDASLKSLEFLLYTHFAIYHLRTKRDLEHTQENMQLFKSYIESIRGQSILQSNEILPLFALPYVNAPDQHPSFQELFSDQWLRQLRTKLENFLEWFFSNRSLPNLVALLQNGERAVQMVAQYNEKNDLLEYRSKETARQMKHLTNDYVNLISITMELVETLQQAIVGRVITNEYIDNVCARLSMARIHGSLTHRSDSPRPTTGDVLIEKLDYGKIKRDIVHISMSAREKALLLQALRWKLTRAKSDYRREKILECYIGCDLLGCRSDIEQRTKIIQQLSSSIGGDTYYVKEEWARLINTIASLRKGRNYLSQNEALLICMQKAACAEMSDSLFKQHLLASLQKLSLRRTVQSILINQNMIKWLIGLLSKTDRLSDYSLEYAVALLMNLCLRTSGRRKCAEIADQAIGVLSALLTHPNHETRPYVNSSLYSILTLRSVREKALQLNLDNRLRSLIRTETSNTETKGQLEFLLNLLSKGGDQDGRETSDNEQDNDDEDQDVMEADLDLADKLRASDKELAGDELIGKQYMWQKGSKYSSTSSLADYTTREKLDPVLHRPVTPGQFRRSSISQRVNSLKEPFSRRNENSVSPKLSTTVHRTSTDEFKTTKSSTAVNQLGARTNSEEFSIDSPPPAARAESPASIRSGSAASSIVDLSQSK